MEVIGRTREMGYQYKKFWGEEYTFRISSMAQTNFTIYFEALEESGGFWKSLAPVFDHMPEINKICGYTNFDPNKVSNDEMLKAYMENLAEDDLAKAFPQHYKKYKITPLDR